MTRITTALAALTLAALLPMAHAAKAHDSCNINVEGDGNTANCTIIKSYAPQQHWAHSCYGNYGSTWLPQHRYQPGDYCRIDYFNAWGQWTGSEIGVAE